MSSKLNHSALCKGWGLTYVCQDKLGVKGNNTFSIVGQCFGRLTSLVTTLLLTVVLSTSSYGQCTLTCDDQKQISLGINGYAVIIPELVLNGDFSCASDVIVRVYDINNQEIGDTVWCGNINQTLQVGVSSASAGAECWSTIVIEDKLAPIISCKDTIIGCSDTALPVKLGYPTIIDNCLSVSNTDLNYFDLYKELPCGATHNGLSVGGRITRSWTALDNHGNVGTCTQNIYFLKEDINNVTFPQHRDDVNGPAISCKLANLEDLTITGQPMLNGSPIENGDGCKLFVSYQDQPIDVCPPASYRVIRRWEITDLCTQDVKIGIQNILIVDKSAPTIYCPDSFSVNTVNYSCGATVILPQASAWDSCSAFTVQPSWEFGTGYGPFNNVPIGVHTITYTAIDQCGNSSSCTSKLSVIDASKPIAICRDELHIALTNDGFAEINALVFDGGSKDNCGLVKWEVARDTLFGDSIRFTCEDIGNLIAIKLRVYDAVGLSSTCNMTVTVADEDRPSFTNCPADITIDCGENYENTTLTGYPTAVDNCGIEEIYYEDDISVNACNIGFVIRNWFVRDAAGNLNTCQQRIQLADNTPISVVFPEDYITNECGADLSVGITGEPVVTGANCESIFVTHTDEVFLIGDSACLKILRTWTIIDWCAFDPNDTLSGNRISAVQLIKIIDGEAPIITDCLADTTFEITDFACETRVELPDLMATDCNPNLTITNTSPYADVKGRNASGMYPIGSTKVRFVVSDGCGNISTCEITITVVDKHAPTPVCKYGLTIPLTEGGFVTVPPNAINSGSYDNCSGEAGLTYEISPNYFTCEDVGKQTINLIVTDQYGNAQFCSTDIYIQDNSGVCSDSASRTAIGGRILTEDGQGMEAVPIQISGGLEEMGYTDIDGNYLFEDLPRDETYTIRPMPNDNYGEGLSTFDLLLIRKHILGITPLKSPYKILAADANNSTTISAFDLVLIRQIVLGTRSDFPENTSWRYIDASYDFPDPRNPFLEVIPEFRDYKRLLINDLDRDFIGVKVGDVNNSASPRAMVESRNNKAKFYLNVSNVSLKTGFEYRIPFKAKDLKNVQGYQFTIDFKPEILQLKAVISAKPINTMSQNNFGLIQSERGKLTTSWENTGVILTNEETLLFTLIFEAKASTELSEVLTINSSITKAEAYNNGDELLDVDLQFSKPYENQHFRLFQNRPNPFKNQTIISFSLPISTEGTISIYNLNGQLLKSYYGNYAQGFNELTVDLSDIHTQTGVLYYHLTTPVSKRLSQKMVLIRE